MSTSAMCPELESPAYWQDFHSTFIVGWREAIADRLPDDYEAAIDEQFRIVQLPTDEHGIPEQDAYRADVAVLRDNRELLSTERARSVATIEPVQVPNAVFAQFRETSIHILRHSDRSLVTVLELLSPTNKQGPGWHEYQQKRSNILHQSINLVELDLLRRGRRPLLAKPLPAGDYFCLVSNVDRHPNCDVYAWAVEHALPIVPVPLHAPDADIAVDLGEVFAATFERGRYAKRLAKFGKRGT